MKDCKPLLNAIIEAMLLLEHSSDDEIDPDIAVRGMENISSHLQAIAGEDKAEVLKNLDEIAAGYRDARYRDFVKGLAETIANEE